MIGNIEIHYVGETAIDLTDPEDFKMMAILRNTEVATSPKPITEKFSEKTLLMIVEGFLGRKFRIFFFKLFVPGLC